MTVLSESTRMERLLRELRRAAYAVVQLPVGRKRLAEWAAAIDRRFVAGDLGATERAVRLLLKLSPDSRYARNMCLLFDRLPPADGSQPAFVDDVDADVQVVARPGADLAILLFCGRSHRLGVPLAAAHRWLGRLPATLIYLRDFHHSQYLRGIPSLGPDLESTIAEIRRLTQALGARRVACYGNSGGVFGALYYGHALGAETVLCISGKTNLTPGFNAFTPGESRSSEIARQFPDATLDARQLYAGAGRSTRIRMVYGRENWSDRRHAEHMAALPCVTLHPIENCSEHMAALEIIRRGEYDRLLEWLVSQP